MNIKTAQHFCGYVSVANLTSWLKVYVELNKLGITCTHFIKDPFALLCLTNKYGTFKDVGKKIQSKPIRLKILDTAVSMQA